MQYRRDEKKNGINEKVFRTLQYLYYARGIDLPLHLNRIPMSGVCTGTRLSILFFSFCYCYCYTRIRYYSSMQVDFDILLLYSSLTLSLCHCNMLFYVFYIHHFLFFAQYVFSYKTFVLYCCVALNVFMDAGLFFYVFFIFALMTLDGFCCDVESNPV